MTPPPNPSTNAARRITPADQPVFPCWLWHQFQGWIKSGVPEQPLVMIHFTHWHPDSPTAPSAPSAPPDDTAPEAVWPDSFPATVSGEPRNASDTLPPAPTSPRADGPREAVAALNSVGIVAYISKHLASLQKEYQDAKDAGLPNPWPGADERTLRDIKTVTDALEVLSAIDAARSSANAGTDGKGEGV